MAYSLSVPIFSSIWFLRFATRSFTLSNVAPVPTSNVFSFVTTARSSVPKSSIVASSGLRERSFVMKFDPVSVQMSSRKARRTSPYPGHLTQHTSKTPRFLLSIRPDTASPITSGAMMSSGSFDATRPSSSVRISARLTIFWSVTRTRGDSSVAVICATSLMNSWRRYPTSISIPSVYSTVSEIPWPSSTVVEPSTPTRSKASPRSSPIGTSLHDIDAMLLNCSRVVTGVASSRTFPAKKWEALMSPRCSATELQPFAT